MKKLLTLGLLVTLFTLGQANGILHQTENPVCDPIFMKEIEEEYLHPDDYWGPGVTTADEISGVYKRGLRWAAVMNKHANNPLPDINHPNYQKALANQLEAKREADAHYRGAKCFEEFAKKHGIALTGPTEAEIEQTLKYYFPTAS